MNKVIETINERISLRKYEDKPLKQEDLDIILDSAMRAPTAGNMMLYSILVIKDEQTKKILSNTCDNQPFIAKAPIILIFLSDVQKVYDYFKYCNVEEYCKEKNLEFRTPDLGKLYLGINDAIIAAENAVIAAESIGIGSCYIGDIVENYQTHKELLNLPDHAMPVAMLCLGYYPKETKRIISPRFNKEYVVFQDKYKRLNEQELKEMYADKENNVNPRNIHGAKNFGQLMYARKFGTDFAEEMEKSLKVMIDNWKCEFGSMKNEG